MKRTIYIIFWLSLVTVLLVFLFRRGEKQQEPTVTQGSPAVTLPVPALGSLRPPVFVRPDAGAAPPAEPEDPAEAALTLQLRNLVKTNPAKVVELALEARQRYGNSRYSDDRDSMLIQAYINLQNMAAARAEMPDYYLHHPHGRWGDYLFALTNVGPNSPP